MGIRKLLRPFRRRPNTEILELLDLMTADNRLGPRQTQPGDGEDGSSGKGWDHLDRIMREELEAEGVGDLENGALNRWFAGAPVGSPAYYRLCCFFLYQKVVALDRWGVIPSLREKGVTHKSQPRIVEFDGANYNSDYLQSLFQILRVAERDEGILSEPRVVMDIGGGWGRIGNALWHINPTAAYVHIDIPITSVVAQHYLPTIADAPAYRYSDYRDKKAILRADMIDRPGFHFLGSHQIEAIEPNFADVVYNIASFGEMSNDTVEFYFRQIGRICNGLFYMQQINFPNEKRGFITDGPDYYPFPSSWEKLYVRNSEMKYQYFESLYCISSGSVQTYSSASR